MSDRPPVLVTGGTGFLGSTLVRELIDSGHEVHVVARGSSRREMLEGLRVHWHTADLLDSPALEAAFRAVSGRGAWVVHAAGLISYRSRDRELSSIVNVEGTRNVLTACRRNGAARVCYVSSVVAVGQAGNSTAQLDETATYHGDRLGCAYVSTKRRAEELVLDARRDLDVVVVNPGAIFGAALEPSNTTRFLAHVAGLRFSTPAPPGSLAVVGVGDVARGIRLALDRGRRGKRYLLTESNWTLAELMAFVLRGLGRTSAPLVIPSVLWRGVVLAAAGIDRVRPLKVATPQTLRLLGEHHRFDSSLARTELGWNPRPFPEVLEDTLSWMRAKGILPR